MKRRMRLYIIPLTALGLSCSSDISGGASKIGVPGADVNGNPGEIAAPEPGALERGGSAAAATGREASLDESPSLYDVLKVVDPASVPDGVPVLSQLRRLTHAEYDRAVTDLVRLDVGDVSKDFPEELPTLQGYFSPSALGTTERLFQELQRSAESVAARVVADPTAFSQVVGCTTQDAACRDAFIHAFGRRAYRRPLEQTEVANFKGLFDAAGEGSPAAGAFAGGVQSVVEAVLQSPNFLYRVERGSAERDEFGVKLAGWEIATRLSFLITGTIPDDALLDAAQAGQMSTPEGIATQARRLAQTPAVQERVKDFHVRWAQLDEIDGIAKDVTVFPQFSPQLVSSIRAGTERFINDVTLDTNGGLQALLTAPYAFVDQNLALLYGLTGSFGSDLQRVDFDAASPRAGLLTQAGFLVGHSSSDSGTSPILRGVFVLRRLLCQPIPDPPPNAQSTVPPPPETPIVSTRDYFEWKTGMAACQGCHSMINPIGFAFENFDGIGHYRDTDNGAPVDASGSIELSTATLSFADGKELIAQLATQPEAQACYARNWLRYAWGRADTQADLRTLTLLRQRLAAPEYGVRDLLVDITQSAAFSHLNESVE
jgi:Protein of unknown function (DUF1592)/Protein of unknown function (DUF1588)/Protein of unknown function (DUF1595)/Protein of unknown function (DUF1585)/Protein of unknown function (DUF1587)